MPSPKRVLRSETLSLLGQLVTLSMAWEGWRDWAALVDGRLLCQFYEDVQRHLQGRPMTLREYQLESEEFAAW